MLNFHIDDLTDADVAAMDASGQTIITAQFVQHVAHNLHLRLVAATPATRRIYAGDVSAAIAESLRALSIERATVSVRGERWPVLRVEVEG